MMMLAFEDIATSSTLFATIFAPAKHGKSEGLKFKINCDRVLPPSVIEQPGAHL